VWVEVNGFYVVIDLMDGYAQVFTNGGKVMDCADAIRMRKYLIKEDSGD
jgi:hypothetical protein